jgi:2-polyprenyl-3-methyl-5-hydroxy-6-metoxy-1,4-benzoquinol methylase
MENNNKMTSKISNEIKKLHDRVAPEYGTIKPNHMKASFSYDMWNFDRHVKKMLSAILGEIYKGGVLLDAGCGNGQISQVFIECGVRKIMGVDFSQNMLKNALNRAQQNKYNHKLLVVNSDLSNLNAIRDHSFEIINLFGVIEHLDEPGVVINNLLEKLSPGGCFILGVPRKYSLSYFSFIICGQSPKRWGASHKLRDYFRFTEKLSYYRFFTPTQIYSFIDDAISASSVTRIPLARSHMDGILAFFHHALGRQGVLGYRILDFVEKIAGFFRLIPGGELWLIRHHSINNDQM